VVLRGGSNDAYEKIATMTPEIQAIRNDLRRLRQTKRQSRMGLGFKLNPALPLVDIEAFESRHGVTLPADYSEFLSEIGNGGCGPYYGVFKLDEMDDGHGYTQLDPRVIGDVARPFPHTSAWNDLTGEPGDDLEAEEYEAAFDAFDARYWSKEQTNGAIPICHVGCAIRIWLVVTGVEVGHLWRDERVDHKGLSPIVGPGLSRVTFAQWYHAWLENELGEREHTWVRT
jgi:hypothetical protein